jgi:hypothetical protein
MKSNSVHFFVGTPDSSSLKALVDGNYRVEMLFNNYSPKARWLSVNKHRDEVEVFIHDNHRAWGE